MLSVRHIRPQAHPQSFKVGAECNLFESFGYGYGHRHEHRYGLAYGCTHGSVLVCMQVNTHEDTGVHMCMSAHTCVFACLYACPHSLNIYVCLDVVVDADGNVGVKGNPRPSGKRGLGAGLFF